MALVFEFELKRRKEELIELVVSRMKIVHTVYLKCYILTEIVITDLYLGPIS